MILVTHNMDQVLKYCDEVVVLEKGRLLMQTDIRTFFENYDYMEKANINPPAIIRFKELLKRDGLEIGSDVLDIDTLAKEIARRAGR